jgi:Spy/CpxP family protein refolding chaperone
MKRRITIIALGAAVLLIAGTAASQPMMMDREGGFPGRGGTDHEQGGGSVLERVLPMLHHLDLSGDQAEEIRDIVDGARRDIEALRGTEDREGLREQFMEMFSSTSITVTEVEGLLNARLEAMEEVNFIIAQAIVDIHGVLTPEQIELMAEFEPGDHQGMGHGGMPGDHAPMMHGGSGIHPQR